MRAEGQCIMPGFVDSHTHALFSGSREKELGMRVKGLSYLEILGQGGGILSTMKRTREAPEALLIAETLPRLKRMFRHGSTTIEVKSGYGLDKKNELKMLNCVRNAAKIVPVDLVSTFIGAHAVPPEYKGRPDQYIDHVISILPDFRELASYVDIFCDKGAFTAEHMHRLFTEARELGFGTKAHVDEIENIGGTRTAIEMGATSVDHMVKTDDDTIELLGNSETIACLLPATPFVLMENEYPRARDMLDANCALALATDMNPNCWTENMQFVVSLAMLQMKMSIEECITASTLNGAYALGVADKCGSLEVGKNADILILDAPNHLHLGYKIGINIASTVIKKGRIYSGAQGPQGT